MFITYSLLYLLCCKPFRHSLHSDFSFSAFQRNSILSVVSCISLTEKIRSPSQISVAAFFSDQRQARFRFERTPARRNRGVELERRVETTRDSRRKGTVGLTGEGSAWNFTNISDKTVPRLFTTVYTCRSRSWLMPGAFLLASEWTTARSRMDRAVRARFVHALLVGSLARLGRRLESRGGEKEGVVTPGMYVR